jgi:RNA polymerase sigma-70 factor, ECF subfamily
LGDGPNMERGDQETEILLDRAGGGDDAACQQLLASHRERLRRMVAVRFDRRLAARIDPSDVVQEALADAARKLPEYLRQRPLPFYPWLRRLAWERLVKVYQRHINAEKRSVTREAPGPLPDESALELARCVLAPGPSPSEQLVRAEQCARARAALAKLSERDREVLVLRYLEQLTTAEIAAVLGVTAGSVKVRHLRALERLRTLLGAEMLENGR